jgi:hypothetical protein
METEEVSAVEPAPEVAPASEEVMRIGAHL